MYKASKQLQKAFCRRRYAVRALSGSVCVFSKVVATTDSL